MPARKSIFKSSLGQEIIVDGLPEGIVHLTHDPIPTEVRALNLPNQPRVEVHFATEEDRQACIGWLNAGVECEGDLIRTALQMMELTHKGYVGRFDLEPEENMLCGRVIGINDVVTFKGERLADLRQAFEDSVEDYLEFCKELGREPNPPSKKR